MVKSVGVVEYTDCISAEVKPTNECPEYDTKPSEALVLELRGMRSTASLPLLPGPR